MEDRVSMSLLATPATNPYASTMHNRTSPTTISPNQQDGYYSHPTPSPQNTDGQDESPQSVGQDGDAKAKTRKFVCQYCSRKFLRAEHLRRHEITHTGDKPFRCPYCKEAFSRSDILKRHIAKCRAASGSEHILIEPETSNAPPRRACDRCARLKVRCDFVQPCSRCSRHQNECTYHRLSSNKPNGSSDERRASQVSVNGNGTTQVSSQPPAESTSLNGIGSINQSTNSFSGFPTPFSLGQTQTVTSPPRMLPAPLTSPSLGIYNLQHSSPQDRLNHISPSNQNSQPSSGPSPFNTFPNIPTPNPSLMDITSSSTSHQPVFSQSMDVNNPTGDVDVMFASTDPSDMIFNSNFSADDTFYSWKPFEYQMNNDASLDFLFGPDLGFFDIGFSPNDPQLGETYVPPTLNNNHNMYPPGDESEKEKEPVPDEGLVATFDPGTGDGEDHVAHSHPPSRAGPRPTTEHHSDYLQLIQVDPLQARCDQLAIAVCGSLENLSSQDSWIQEFFTTENIKNNLFLWSKRYAQHVPVIHLPTFSILTAPDALLFILCVIGKAYSRPGIDTERLQWCVDVFTRLSAMERVNGELDFKNLEANFILVVLCTWHGNKPQREHAKRLFKEVCDTAKRHGYNKVQPAKETDGSDEAKWKAWIDQETRIRFMMNVYLMDGGYVVFFNKKPILNYQEIQLPYPCDNALWAAPNVAAWKKEMQRPRERDWLPQSLDALIRAQLRPEDDHTDLYGKFLLIHGLINYIWERQYEIDCQIDPSPTEIMNFRTTTTRALNNWRQLWDTLIPRLKMDRSQWARLGFFRNSLEYWYAAKLFLARPRRTGWNQPYDDDNNLFRVKRLLRIVRVWVVGGESKSGLSKRDLMVPNFLETLKVVVPELASVRIEEAPSVVPSPRPIWKGDLKKEKS